MASVDDDARCAAERGHLNVYEVGDRDIAVALIVAFDGAIDPYTVPSQSLGELQS
jgi:hypothetical protein